MSCNWRTLIIDPMFINLFVNSPLLEIQINIPTRVSTGVIHVYLPCMSVRELIPA